MIEHPCALAEITEHKRDFEDVQEVDSKLIKLAKMIDAVIVTNIDVLAEQAQAAAHGCCRADVHFADVTAGIPRGSDCIRAVFAQIMLKRKFALMRRFLSI